MLGLMRLRGIISVSSVILQLRTDVSCWVMDWTGLVVCERVCACACLSVYPPG
jgi:hypothetical protein